MTCWYTLLLRYSDQKFYLSPRSSIIVSEDRDLESVSDRIGCSTCGKYQPDTWKITANFKGSCSLASAWSLFRQLESFLEDSCDEDLIIERTVCGEIPLVFKVTKTSLRMIDTISQWGKPRVLKMEIIFSLQAWVEEEDGVVLVGV